VDLDKMNESQLRTYLEFLLRNYRVMDAFWFINIEKRHGLDEACRINELVWGKVSQLAARDLKAQFDLKQGGLEGFMEAQKLFPWSRLVGYEYHMDQNQLIIEVPECPAQLGRLKHGQGEYPCKAMHKAEFEGFAKEIDPAIRVECLFAPPDPHPEKMYCRWRFSLEP
jgi:hypothetical protein